MILIQLLCGLAFFGLGLALLVRLRPIMHAHATGNFHWLALFGVSYALSEWLTAAGQIAPQADIYRQTALIAAAISYAALLQFSLTNGEEKRSGVRRLGMMPLLAVIAIAVITFQVRNLGMVEFANRYALGLPGGLLAAWMLLTTHGENSHASPIPGGWPARLAGGAFALFAVLTVFSSPADFFPASVFNRDAFAETIGVPIEFFCAATAVVIAVAIVSLLNQVDRIEKKLLIDQAEAERRALKASEASLSLAQRVANIGNWDWNIETDHLEWSDQIFRIFGLDRRYYSASFAAFFNIIHPEDRDRVRQAARQAMDGQQPFAVEHRIILPSGEIRWVQERGEVFHSPDGKPVRMIGTVQDISELRRAQDAERESERRFRDTFEWVAVGVALFGLDGRFLRVNRKLCDILGYSREELLDMTFEEITHPEDVDRDMRSFNRLLAGTETTCNIEKRYHRKDGKVIWATLTMVLARDENGHPDYFISVIDDITRRKQAEDAVRESEVRLRTIIDNVTDAILTTSAAGVIESVNQATLHIFGYEESELIGQGIDILIPEHERANHRRYIREYLDTGTSRVVGVGQRELSGQHRDGTVIPLEAAIDDMALGGERKFIITLRDITDRKRIEAQLRQAQKMEAVGQLTGRHRP